MHCHNDRRDLANCQEYDAAHRDREPHNDGECDACGADAVTGETHCEDCRRGLRGDLAI